MLLADPSDASAITENVHASSKVVELLSIVVVPASNLKYSKLTRPVINPDDSNSSPCGSRLAILALVT